MQNCTICQRIVDRGCQSTTESDACPNNRRDTLPSASRAPKAAPIRCTVQTRDVDGSGSRKFKTLKAAVARFEAMYGHSLERALGDMYYDEAGFPTVTVEQWEQKPLPRVVRAVSDYGTVVALIVESA